MSEMGHKQTSRRHFGTAAARQVAAVLPQVDWEIAPSSDYLAVDLVDAPIRHTNGRLAMPEGPGLGVKVD
jgi:L-alanine-DL-glutamate epimerase-like enolase superfamily enzyme